MTISWARRRFENQEFTKYIGIKMESIEEGKATFSLDWRKEITQNQGFIHGGIVTAMADIACGHSALSTLEEGTEIVTVELKINFIRPAIGNRIIATGKVVNSGRTLIVVESEVANADTGKIIAKCLATFMPIEKK